MPNASSPLPEEMDALVRLARGIVIAQGNVFIKELLRDRGIRIGTTKDDFERNMVQAIYAGELRREHVEAWLREVEGWGNQHIYMYRIPKDLRRFLLDDKALEKSVSKSGFIAKWNAEASLEYPEARTLARIDHAEGQLTFTWHQGVGIPVRKKERDYQSDIDGDMYEFRAYRLRAERTVMRFVARPTADMAAIFLQDAWDEKEHADAINSVRQVASRLLQFDDLELIAVAPIIKKA